MLSITSIPCAQISCIAHTGIHPQFHINVRPAIADSKGRICKIFGFNFGLTVVNSLLLGPFLPSPNTAILYNNFLSCGREL